MAGLRPLDGAAVGFSQAPEASKGGNENAGGEGGIRTPVTLSGISVFKLRRNAGVSEAERSEAEAGVRSRNPDPAKREKEPENAGGGRGIRTPDTLSGISVFKTDCFNRSHIPPLTVYQLQDGRLRRFFCSRCALTTRV